MLSAWLQEPGAPGHTCGKLVATERETASSRSLCPLCLGACPMHPCTGLSFPEPGERFRNGDRTLVSVALTRTCPLLREERGAHTACGPGLRRATSANWVRAPCRCLTCQLSMATTAATAVNNATVPCLALKGTNMPFHICVSDGSHLGTDGSKPPVAPRAPPRGGRPRGGPGPRRCWPGLAANCAHLSTDERTPQRNPLTHHPHPSTSALLWRRVMPPLCHPSILLTFLMRFKANCKHLQPSL